MKIVLTLASLLLSICVISTSAAPDYKVDAGFQPPVFTGPFATKIHTALALPDGKILVGGSFTTVGGQPIKLLVRLNSDGTRDTSFNSALTEFTAEPTINSVDRIRALPGGDILVMGRFAANGLYSNHAKLNSDGSLDLSMQPGQGPTYDMLQLPDGKFIACGPGGPNPIARRLNADGSLDSSFQITAFPNGDCRSVELVAGEKILMAGSFSDISGTQWFQPIQRFNADASLDNTFQTQLPGSATRGGMFALLPDGKIIISYRPHNSGSRGIVRLGSDGQTEMTVSGCSEGDTGVFHVASTGTLLASRCRKFSGAPFYEFAIIGDDGKMVPSLDYMSFQNSVVGFQDAPDGKYYVIGSFNGIEGTARSGIARLMPYTRTVRAKFDFDGDGRSDCAVFRPSDRIWYINHSTEGPSYTPWGLSTDLLAAGDYDDDGRSDITVYRDGLWHFNLSSAGYRTMEMGSAGDKAMVGNFDGTVWEGINNLDPILRRVQNGSVSWLVTLYTSNATGFHPGSVAGELPSDTPVIGDFDGDSRDEYGYFRDGAWVTKDYLNGPLIQSQWGSAGDIPVPDDYDGDGQTDYAVFRPSTGVWWINRSTEGWLIIRWGISSDIPVPADYDGDGRADIAIYRAGQWWQLLTSNGSVAVANWGVPGDVPIQAQSR